MCVCVRVRVCMVGEVVGKWARPDEQSPVACSFFPARETVPLRGSEGRGMSMERTLPSPWGPWPPAHTAPPQPPRKALSAEFLTSCCWGHVYPVQQTSPEVSCGSLRNTDLEQAREPERGRPEGETEKERQRGVKLRDGG